MKQKPKSCMCRMCRLMKGRERPGFKTRTFEERAFRRATNAAVRMGAEVIPAAPRGSYIA